MRYPHLREMMLREDTRPPLRVDKTRINFSVLSGVVKHLHTPELVRRVHDACGEGVNVQHYAIAIWSLKVMLKNPELDRAWDAMMDGLAPRGGTAVETQASALEPDLVH